MHKNNIKTFKKSYLRFSLLSLMLLATIHNISVADPTQKKSKLQNQAQEIKQLKKTTSILTQQVQVLTGMVRQLVKQKNIIIAENDPPAKVSVARAPVSHTITRTDKDTVAMQQEALVAKETPEFATGFGSNTSTFAADVSNYTLGTPVTTSPYVGTIDTFSEQNLYSQISDIGNDFKLLNERHKLVHRAEALGIKEPKHALVNLSGVVDVIGNAERSYQGKYRSDINLVNTKIDIAAYINNWATAFLGINYDSNPSSDNASRITNSRLFIEKGFLVIGNLDRSPFYVSLGQMYFPFGDFGSYMISDPLTTFIGETNTRGISFGYHQEGDNAFYANVYGFQGDTSVGTFVPGAMSRPSNGKINNFGVNVGHLSQVGHFNADLRAGYIANLADAHGMQNTLSGGFGGFGLSSVTEVLEHPVPGVDLYGQFKYRDYTIKIEGVTATRSFAMPNLSFNGEGATPKAWMVEAAYHFNIFNIPSDAAIGYNGTADALALGLPRTRYLAVLNMNIWRDVLAAFEIRHDINYGKHDTAFGQRIPISGAADVGNSRTRISALLEYQF